MASVQYSSGSCLGQNRNFKPFPIVQPGKTRHSINLVTKQANCLATFSKLSIGEKHSNYGSKMKEDQWKVCCSNDGSCGIAPIWSTPSVLDLVLDFYSAINLRDTQKLNQLLSDDCVFQDLIFYIPFGGKQNIINFLQEVMEAMGENVHFVIDSWMEGERLTASVIWHLEWKAKEIPFTTGCNFFECQQVDEKLIISKITGVEELPVKPGELLLKLLKAVSGVCDGFPFAAEQLLTGSHGHEGVIKLLEMIGAYKKK
ncbi:hypothetical protein DITRI_Ditri05aG0106400 [Diplodiscus trichospermus]